MPTFDSRPLSPPRSSLHAASLNGFLKKHPAFFGLPFVLIIVGASFALKSFTDVGVEKKDTKVTVVTKDEEVKRKLGTAKRFDIREEYFKHFSKHPDAQDWDNVRIARPRGTAEWGESPQDTRKPVRELVRK